MSADGRVQQIRSGPAQRRADTVAYLADRERVLGRTFRVRRDPEQAGDDIAAALGGRELARRWLIDVLAEMRR